MSKTLAIRFAVYQDLDFLYNSLVELFTEQQVLDRFSQTKETLLQNFFSAQPIAEALIAELDNVPVGFAIFSMTNRNFLLFDGPGLYLHDLFVKEQGRRQGIATKLLARLNELAKERLCTRIDWVLLTKNNLGRDFYSSIETAKPVDYIQYMRINSTNDQ
ncbi:MULTISPECIES: GNAT family N-acetyltransferase [unclassified Legionella]|uniref:GNAT family N-acetyltransferase n=1 Tax=unclassified Legionella TaxID=2622702 RepID=UPI0010567294|nr:MULTISPECIES: GNAT family N-acetyltransferase [unclassified Legionella]MDI9819767.1 GNAT family N-acetyltransferase [Legionella sp. PL877]